MNVIAIAALVAACGSGASAPRSGAPASSAGSPQSSASTAAVVASIAPSSGGSSVSPAPASTTAELRTDSPGASPATSPPPAASAAPTPAESTVAEAPIVPVANFRSTVDSISAADVRALVAGDDARFAALELVDSDADAILSALGLDRGRLGGRLVSAPDARRLATDLAAHRDRLAFLPADQIGPSVRALGWGGSYLFGNARVRSLAAWKLRARVAVPADASTRYDPRRAWSLVAGGDILLDRGVALAIKANRRAADFPFDGGTADILSRYCCSSFGWDLPRTARTGNGGAMRDLLSSADLTIANFENPAPTSFRFHAKGTVFSANPAYIKGLKNAGIDWVSLANNHIGDAGRAGIASTMQNLDRFGIRHGGAGRNLAEARKPVILEAGGTRVGLLAYDTIAKYYAAKGGTAGSAQLTKSAVATDVARARAAGAELVIVFPHWGVEYRARPFDAEQALARAAIDAGADMVIGNHAHWAGGMEVYKGKPIWYALGNFVFDQTWSEPTMEGMTLELTFDGARLIQVRLHPHVILDRGQPNLLDPAGDGRVVLGQVFRASKGLLKW